MTLEEEIESLEHNPLAQRLLDCLESDNRTEILISELINEDKKYHTRRPR